MNKMYIEDIRIGMENINANKTHNALIPDMECFIPLSKDRIKYFYSNPANSIRCTENCINVHKLQNHLGYNAMSYVEYQTLSTTNN